MMLRIPPLHLLVEILPLTGIGLYWLFSKWNIGGKHQKGLAAFLGFGLANVVLWGVFIKRCPHLRSEYWMFLGLGLFCTFWESLPFWIWPWVDEKMQRLEEMAWNEKKLQGQANASQG